MPKVTDNQEAAIKRVIRDAMALDPLITLRSLMAIVERKLNRSMGFHYLMRLKRTVDGEVVVRADQEKIEKRISQMRENNRIMREGLLKIAYPPDGDYVAHKDRMRAMEIIAKIDHSQAKIEMEFGLFNKKPGELNDDMRLRPVDEETSQAMVAAFKNWGLAPPQMRKIEPIKIVNVEPKKTPHEQPQQQPAATAPGLVASE